jgi:hypothetical protein
MDLFSKEQLTELAALESEPCVSIFMPIYHVESEVGQNPIRLKNLMKKARQELLDQDYREPDIESLLAPLNALMERNGFWLDQSDGFAAFLAPEQARFFRLPIDFEELVLSGRRFHLKPLFPLLAANNRFYVLALSKNKVRLFQGTHYSISEIESKDIPESLLDVLSLEERQRSLQNHTGNVAGGRQDAVFHGHGATSDDEPHRPHDELVRYFHGVDEGVRSVLNEESAPMVLAGVEYYLPIYRDVNRYGDLVDDSIVAGNPDHMKPRELHGKAWDVVSPLFLKEQTASLERYQRLMGNGQLLASDDICEVLPAAAFGRVDTLFVEIDAHQWGLYHEDRNAVERHENHQVGDEDLLDLAAVHTLLNGGTVHALRSDNMPTERLLAATFRYPADVSAEEA